MTRDDIRRAAQRAGLSDRPICLHSSLRSFGHVEGGANTVVEGLLEAGCTVMVPAHSYDFAAPPPDAPRMRPTRNGMDYLSHRMEDHELARIFTPDSNELSRGSMGAISGAVLAMPHRERGNHPVNSFAAVGPLARDLIEVQSPDDVYAPLEALEDHGGFVVLMGVGLTTMTLLHLAEKRAGREMFRRWSADPQGEIAMIEIGSCSRGFDAFEPVLAPLEQRIAVGSSIWRIWRVADVLNAATEAVRNDPMITHCGDDTCGRCRDAVLGGPILRP